MLLTRLRVRPCRARFWRSSSGRSTSRVDVLLAHGDLARQDALQRALRALDRDVPRRQTVTSTPDGDGDGGPADSGHDRLPHQHVAEDLAADPALARLAVGHEPLAGGQDGDTETTEHPRQRCRPWCTPAGRAWRPAAARRWCGPGRGSTSS